MRLVLQCAACGTVNAVGLTECGTCRATGLENLRLLFECPRCFHLDLRPSCETCSKLLPLGDAYEVVSDPPPIDPKELAGRWGVEDDPASSTAPIDPAWDELPEAEVMLSIDETTELAVPDEGEGERKVESEVAKEK